MSRLPVKYAALAAQAASHFELARTHALRTYSNLSEKDSPFVPSIKARLVAISNTRLEVNPRLTRSIGRARTNYGNSGSMVEISARVFAIPQNARVLPEVFLHEIAHVATPGCGHDAVWQYAARAIGSVGSRLLRLPAEPPTPRAPFVFRCSCGRWEVQTRGTAAFTFAKLTADPSAPPHHGAGPDCRGYVSFSDSLRRFDVSDLAMVERFTAEVRYARGQR